MKALLVADTDTSVRMLTDCLKPYGFDIIRYRSAVKALDNIVEIAPDAVFISTADFPRHWKTLAQFIMADSERDKTIVVLLTDSRFTGEDADKAMHIGVHAIIDEKGAKAEDEKRLSGIFSRYKPSADLSGSYVYEDIGERAVFLFTNPINDTIITGKVESLSRSEIRFRPDAPSATSDLAAGDKLEQCSLKLDGSIIAPECRIARNGNVIIFDIARLQEKDKAVLEKFISEAV